MGRVIWGPGTGGGLKGGSWQIEPGMVLSVISNTTMMMMITMTIKSASNQSIIQIRFSPRQNCAFKNRWKRERERLLLSEGRTTKPERELACEVDLCGPTGTSALRLRDDEPELPQPRPVTSLASPGPVLPASRLSGHLIPLFLSLGHIERSLLLSSLTYPGLSIHGERSTAFENTSLPPHPSRHHGRAITIRRPGCRRHRRGRRSRQIICSFLCFSRCQRRGQ